MLKNSKISNTIALSKYLEIGYHSLIDLCRNPQYHKIVTFSPRGKKRVFYTPNVQLKKTQRKLNQWFREEKRKHWETSDTTNKALFQIESSCINHARLHAGKKHILQVDIKNFFSSISQHRVYDFFKDNLNNDNLAASLALLTTYKNMLPTGAPSSSAVAEMLIHKLDEKLIDYSQKNNLTYSRYLDDLCFSSNHYINMSALFEIENIVTSEHFQLNHNKTRFQSNKAKQTVTGITVNEHPNVNRKYMRLLRSVVHSIKTKGLEKSMEIYKEKFPEQTIKDVIHFSNIIEGKLAWVAAVKGVKNKEYLKMKEVVLKSSI
jgi:RNA-directed DNA polymerase